MAEKSAKFYSEELYYINPESLDGSHYFITQEHSQILEKINQKVAGGTSLDNIMDFLFENIPGPCDRIGLAFIEDNGKRVRAHWGKSKNGNLLLKKGFWQDLNGSTLKEIIDTGKIRIINDLEKYLYAHPHSVSTKLIVQEGFLSSMTCPLIVDNRPIGFFFRSAEKRNAFSVEDIIIHAKIAERIAQAVEKARKIEELTELNNAYTELLAFVSHEIKNPISSIIMDTELLLNGYLGEMNEKQREKIAKIAAKAKFLLETAKDYLNLARIEGTEIKIEKKEYINLTSLIEDTISLLDTHINAKKMLIIRDFENNGLNLFCDHELIKIALLNLIGNAIKYGKENGKIKITAVKNENEILVKIWNEGHGFSKDSKSMLFKKFSRLKEPELMRQKGSGVGLYTVWKIINAHGGKVFANSEPGSWAEFSFSIPLSEN